MRIMYVIFMMGMVLQGCSWFEPDFKEIEDPAYEIQLVVDKYNIPSVTAWVVKGDKIVWEGFYGYANVRDKKAADSSTIYGVASISKLFIVTAVMQLEEQGHLDLETDINDYFPFHVRNPNYPDQKITLKHLLTHRSGLAWPENNTEIPGYYIEYNLDDAPPMSEWIPQYILPGGDDYYPQVWKNTAPGERELYSNIGASLAAYIVEVASGIDFSEYCVQHIFEPLNMFNTSYRYADLPAENLATLYLNTQQQHYHHRYKGYATGDLKTTGRDLARFIMAFQNGGIYEGGRIIQSATIDRMLEIQNPATGVCLIWNKTLDEWYGHAGGKTGTSAYVEFKRDSDLALFVVSNLRHFAIYPGEEIHALVRRIAHQYE